MAGDRGRGRGDRGRGGCLVLGRSIISFLHFDGGHYKFLERPNSPELMIFPPTSFYQPGVREACEPAGPKIALSFPRLSVCCASTLITCAILRHVLLCHCSLLLY